MLVFQRQAIAGKVSRADPPPEIRAEYEIVWTKPLHHFKDATGGIMAALVGHRV